MSEDTTTEAASVPGPGRMAVPGRRWVAALIGGMLAWFVRLVVGSFLVAPACEMGPGVGRLLLLAVSAAGIAICVFHLWLSFDIRKAASEEQPWWEAVGVAAALVNAAALIAIVLESAPILFIDLCT